MLTIKVPISPEEWDEVREEFVITDYVTLELEHSLVSLSKWESKYHKSFLYTKEKTIEETLDYIKFMTLTENVDPDIYNHLTQENVQEINEYIDNPMTATTIPQSKGGKGGQEIVTAELIYYWMISLQIPVEFQYWHLNRLITLVRVCEVKQNPPKKMGKRELMSRNAQLNAARRQQLNTKG